MQIEDVRIGMKLHNPHANRTGIVTRIEKEGGLILRANGLSWNEHVENVEPVGEFNIGDRVRQIGPSECGFVDNMGDVGTIEEIRPTGRCVCRWDSGGANTMPPTSIEHVRDFRPLAEIAKCYVQVEPEKLLLTQDARRVIEYLTATDTPVNLWRIVDEMGDMMTDTSILDGLIEARGAGRVRLDEGKYSILRD